MHLWRWTCTPLSADRGEISILACVETLIAMSISLWIAWSYQTIMHILISACFVPLLLLRTRRSTTIGPILYCRTNNHMRYTITNLKYIQRNKKNPAKSAFCSLYLYSLMIFLALYRPFSARIASIFISFGKGLFYVASSIPANWSRIIFCVDSTHPVELFPGITRISRRRGEYFYADHSLFDLITQYIDGLKRNHVKNLRYFYKLDLCAQIPWITFGVIIYFLPPLLYRFSLKSTAIIWSPLIFIISSARNKKLVQYQLRDITMASIYKIMRWYSVSALVLFLAKMFVLLGPQTISLNSRIKPLIEPFIEPARLPSWQVASALSAVLALALYHIADWHLIQMDNKKPSSSLEERIKWQLGIINVVRACLATFTIVCTLSIAWTIASDVHLPYFEWVWFPWGE